MPRGKIPFDYLCEVRADRPAERVFADLNAFTCELYEDEVDFHRWVEAFVLLPPLRYEGRFVKGILFSQGVDLINARFPELRKLFHTAAYSMCCSYPWAESADALLSIYPNRAREDWYRQTHPLRAHLPLIPLQDADYTNEYVFGPTTVFSKNIDLLCISRLDPVKNLPVIAKALKSYRSRYPEKPIRLTLIIGKDFDADLTGLDGAEKAEYRKLAEILGEPRDYIDFVPRVDHYSLPPYYTRSRFLILGSLIEGKNRCINESLCCNTPIICFEALNQHIRGNAGVFPENSGVYAPFDPDGLADTIFEVIDRFGDFTPRRSYLKQFGRKNFFNTCLPAFPYYRANIEGLSDGPAFTNLWIDLAVQDNYKFSLNDFIYDKYVPLSRAQGLESIATLVEDYTNRWFEIVAE